MTSDAKAPPMQRFKRYSMKTKLGLIFAFSFTFGAFIEAFAIKTGLYKTVVANKASRRYELDEFVLKFRRDVQSWTEEDMRRAGIAVPAKDHALSKV